MELLKGNKMVKAGYDEIEERRRGNTKTTEDSA